MSVVVDDASSPNGDEDSNPKKSKVWAGGPRVFRVANIPPQGEDYVVERAVAHAYHTAIARSRASSKSQQDRAMNFSLELKHDERGTGRLQPRAILRLPQYGSLFFEYIATHPVLVTYNPVWGHPKTEKATLTFSEAHDSHFKFKERKKLSAMPWQDPLLKKEHRERVEQLRSRSTVFEVQFGFRDHSPKIDEFCVEWSRRFDQSECYIEFLDGIHTIQFHLGDHTDRPHEYIKLRYENIKDITLEERGARPTYTFYLWNAPILERGPQHPSESNRRERLAGLDEAHERVMSYYPTVLRAVILDTSESESLKSMAQVIGLKIKPVRPVDSYRRQWLAPTNTRKITHMWLKDKQIPFQIAFQVASWLQNGVFSPREIESLRPAITDLLKSTKLSLDRIVQLLYQFSQATWDRRYESLDSQFKKFRTEFEKKKDVLSKGLKSGWFWCHRATITPTTIRLEGPLPDQSNSVVREYSYASHCFLRVTFTDEERMQIRWDKDVEVEGFVARRIGGLLARGIEIAGHRFVFLGYSNSGLREHSVWFVTEFKDPNDSIVTAEIIRSRIGDFSASKKNLDRQPAKLGARLAQAFSATEPSVRMKVEEVEEVDDIKCPRPPRKREEEPEGVKEQNWRRVDKTKRNDIQPSPPQDEDSEENDEVNGVAKVKREEHALPASSKRFYEFTDGYGTISPNLADEIWSTLNGNAPQLPEPAPRAYQVRIGGAKGVVGIDYTLEGRQLKLRESMVKFPSRNLDLHIAVRFDHPLALFLNRPLITVLEHIGFPIDWFMSLQEAARDRAQKMLRKFDAESAEFLRMNRLGNPYNFHAIVKKLVEEGVTLKELEKAHHPQREFLSRSIETALVHVERELKYRARIPVPDGLSLVGIADIHKELEPDQVYICIEKTGEAREWISGSMFITRSPSVHPGDVQRFIAIMPPKGSIYDQHPMVNCLVFSVKGDRPPADKLSGGDLDGDLFQIIPDKVPFEVRTEAPGDYEGVDAKELNRPAQIEDIQQFVVDFINSDRMGLIGTKHLVVADQSRQGPLDESCLKLAELYSHAVDFAKSGVPVDFKDIPPRIFDLNPDFCRKEVSLQDQTDYYESHKALGVLFRAINIQPLKPREFDTTSPQIASMQHPISQLLKRLVGDLLPAGMAGEETDNVKNTFLEYARELHAIKRIYSVGRDPLSEEEVFIGTIVELTSRMNRRDDLSFRLREVTAHLVDRVKFNLQGYLHEDSKRWLARSCRAWQYSLDKRVGETAKGEVFPEWRDAQCSFGWIALGSALECLDVLNGRRRDSRRVQEKDE